ncbi:hypothetical protein Ciccas_009823 [Cichlidogyrus casuarinus]|uniref:Uncharacterized protein n=1 Tax=Cichlidogyrus casuarinus TaxID=1844966 RepID=A0ABD2PVW7_9PLAT
MVKYCHYLINAYCYLLTKNESTLLNSSKFKLKIAVTYEEQGTMCNLSTRNPYFTILGNYHKRLLNLIENTSSFEVTTDQDSMEILGNLFELK